MTEKSSAAPVREVFSVPVPIEDRTSYHLTPEKRSLIIECLRSASMTNRLPFGALTKIADAHGCSAQAVSLIGTRPLCYLRPKIDQPNL